MKKLLGVLISIVLILIVAALAAPYFISADTLKKPLIDKIEAATGRKLTVDGAFRLKFFPVAGVTMENVTLSNPPGYGEAPPFITLKSLDVGVSLLPLLHKDIEVQKLVLDEPRINLHVNKAGVKNWQFSKAPSGKTSAASPSAAPSAASLPQNLRLSDVAIKNGVVSYQDEADKSAWDIGKLNATMALNAIDAPFSFNGNGEWNHKIVKVKASVDSLRKLMQGQAARLDASVDADALLMKANGSLSLTDYRGKLDMSSPSLKDLLAWANPAAKPLATSAALALALSGDAQCSKQSCGLTNAKLALDKIQATGNVKATYGNGATPDITLNLTSNTLDFNPFLPPTGRHADASGVLLTDAWADPAPAGWSGEPMDLSALKAVNLTADIKDDGIICRKLTIGKNTLHADLKGGQLNGRIADADLYSGKGNAGFTVNAAAAPLAIETHIDLKAVQAEPLLKDVANSGRISGAADFKLDATSKGASERDIVSALAGSGNFKLTGGEIRGIDLANIPQTLAGGLKLSDNPAQKTAISDMGGSFTIAQGIVSNKDLVMNAALLHMSGQGEINLPQQTIDYRLTPQIVNASAQGAAQKGVAVPVVIQGSLDSPTFRPDLQGTLQNALKNPQQFKQELKNSRETLKQQLKNPDAVNQLKGLLKGF